MTKPKSTAEVVKTQRQKFIEAARDVGADDKNDTTFWGALRKVAAAPPQKAKKAAVKRKT